MKKSLCDVIVVLLIFSLPAYSLAHSGGTDACGCHTNRKTEVYHCHTPKVGRSLNSLPKMTRTTKSTRREFEATVIRETDGDTIVARTANFEDIKIRLYGIDAPELSQPGGVEAAKALRTLYWQSVKAIEMDTDRYSRTAALIEYRGRSVNLDMVMQGHAWYYEQYCQHKPIYGSKLWSGSDS